MPYQTNSQSQFSLKKLRIIFLGLLAGICLFQIIMLSSTPNKGISFNTTDPFVIVALFLSIGGIVAGPFVAGKILAGAANKATVREKLLVYQAAFIQRSALLEGASLFSIVSYSQSGNLLFVIIVCLLIGVFLTNYPTSDKIATALNISTSDLEPELQG